MTKLSFSSFVFISVLCISCTSNISLDGTWVESYSQWIDSTGVAHKDYVNSGYLYSFKNDSVLLKSFRLSGSDKAIDTLVHYEQKDGFILFGDTDEDSIKFDINKDSIVFTINGAQTTQIICRKLPDASKGVHWNPTGKQYKVSREEGKILFDFVNDSTLYTYTEGISKLVKFNWEVMHIDKHIILRLNLTWTYITVIQ